MSRGEPIRPGRVTQTRDKVRSEHRGTSGAQPRWQRDSDQASIRGSKSTVALLNSVTTRISIDDSLDLRAVTVRNTAVTP